MAGRGGGGGSGGGDARAPAAATRRRLSRCRSTLLATVVVAAAAVLLFAGGAAAQRGPSKPQDNRPAAESSKAPPGACQDEWHHVMCSDIPADKPGERAACCELHTRHALPATAAALVDGAALDAAEFLKAVARPDLEAGDPRSVAAGPPDYMYDAGCVKRVTVQLPVFEHVEIPAAAGGGNSSSAAETGNNATAAAAAGADASAEAAEADATTRVRVEEQTAPALDAVAIWRVKRAALAAAKVPGARAAARLMAARARALRSARAQGTPLKHPGGYVGAGELALLSARLAGGVQPQVAANESLITGRGVPPKVYKSGWRTVADTVPGAYPGPYPMKKFEADYGAWILDNSTCPPNYPEGAPVSICGHVALIELDAKQAYKHAAAYAATRDARHADDALRIIRAWAGANKEFGIRNKNGPLEAGWGVAAMARALELLRATYPSLARPDVDGFLDWVYEVLVPQMDFYADVITPNALAAGRRGLYGNWHATIADAYMAVAVLADDRPMYEKGLGLYRATVREYFKWGRDNYAAGRVLGEATETLRDIYHTLFGLGSLVQAAETAWAQGEDVYSESGHVLAAAMELHARIVNAKDSGDDSLLPEGFAWFSDMPAPPANCSWRWDIETQLWASYNANGTKCSDLRDGIKYLLGVKYLPNGFELGYNHFAGRLGLKMPETAALLRANPVDWFEFCWGLATLTHADTAKDLWRRGLTRAALCAPRRPEIRLAAPEPGSAGGGAAFPLPFQLPTVQYSPSGEFDDDGEPVVGSGSAGYDDGGVLLAAPAATAALGSGGGGLVRAAAVGDASGGSGGGGAPSIVTPFGSISFGGGGSSTLPLPFIG